MKTKICDLRLTAEEKMILSLCWNPKEIEKIGIKTGKSDSYNRGILKKLTARKYLKELGSIYDNRKRWQLNRKELEL